MSLGNPRQNLPLFPVAPGKESHLPHMKNVLASPPHPALMAACLFCSGLCALVYQTVWLREFRLIFGASTAATAAVSAVFMGGVGLGSYFLGRKADGWTNPFRTYGRLEWLIALCAAMTPLLLLLASKFYLALGGTFSLGMIVGTVLRLVLAAIILAGPTFLMGGTLPAAVRAVRDQGDTSRRRVAWLYAANTFGAVTGAMLATFWMLEHFGNRLTLWLACALNLAVALLACFLARRSPDASESAERHPATPVASGLSNAAAAPAKFVCLAAAVVGFVFFLLELVWYRMLSPLLGGSSFSFGLILAVALLGIGVGSAIYGARGAKGASTLRGFAFVCALEALCVAVPYALGDRLAVLAVSLQTFGEFGFLARVCAWSVLAGIVVFPASVVAGYQFPMLIGLLGQGSRGVGSHTGLAYAWNTVGAILGSLAGGFGLIPLLSAPGVWRFVVILLVALSVAALCVDASARRGWKNWAALLPAGSLALILLGATGPTAAWRHTPIGAGRTRMVDANSTSVEDFLRSRRRMLIWEADGVESSLALIKDANYSFLVNGKSDGSARGDAATQVMVGMVGALTHPDPRRALVIGLGTGSTAGWLAAIPGMERVDVVELEPQVAYVARACAPVNHHALDNPKLHLRFGDAREAMLTTSETYDLIVSEPSNPYRAGVSSLYTEEFYQAAAQRLRPSGMFVQWVQAYEVDGETISVIYATMASVFNAVDTWRSECGDLFFIGAQENIVYDLGRIQQRLGEEPYRSASMYAWRMMDVEGFFSRFVAHAGLAQAVLQKGIQVNTDDRNLLEFAFARTVGRKTKFNTEALKEIARAEGYGLPPFANGDLDSETLGDRSASLAMLEGVKDIGVQSGVNGLHARTAAKVAGINEDWPAVLRHWGTQTNEPADLVEILLLARAAAKTGDEGASAYNKRRPARRPSEGTAVLAHYLAARGRVAESLICLDQAMRAWQTDPWPPTDLIGDSLALAKMLPLQPNTRPALLRLCETMGTPFAVALADGERLLARVEIALKLEGGTPSELTRQALHELEPSFPWDASLLAMRADCYEATQDPRAALARREQQRLARNEARRFQYATRSERPLLGVLPVQARERPGAR